jgi:hypothetical protein
MMSLQAKSYFKEVAQRHRKFKRDPDVFPAAREEALNYVE